MWVIKVASISACLRYTVIDITSGSNRCSNRYVIIVHLDRERIVIIIMSLCNRAHRIAMNESERIRTYMQVHARPKSGINVVNSDQINTKSEILSRQSNQNIFYRI